MSRLQLALNVSDIDQGVDFYSRLFGVTPHKRRPGYANFEVADPPLKLVLFEAGADAERLNHLGVEMTTIEQVGQTTGRLQSEGLDPDLDPDTTCCFATQEKAWVTDPDGSRWEVYTITDDDPDGLGVEGEEGAACAASADGEESAAACC